MHRRQSCTGVNTTGRTPRGKSTRKLWKRARRSPRVSSGLLSGTQACAVQVNALPLRASLRTLPCFETAMLPRYSCSALSFTCRASRPHTGRDQACPQARALRDRRQRLDKRPQRGKLPLRDSQQASRLRGRTGRASRRLRGRGCKERRESQPSLGTLQARPPRLAQAQGTSRQRGSQGTRQGLTLQVLKGTQSPPRHRKERHQRRRGTLQRRRGTRQHRRGRRQRRKERHLQRKGTLHLQGLQRARGLRGSSHRPSGRRLRGRPSAPGRGACRRSARAG